MARADNFRTRQQQLYKNPFSGGGVTWHVCRAGAWLTSLPCNDSKF